MISNSWWFHDIQMAQENGRWTGPVQSVFVLLNDRGEIVGKNDRIFRLLFEPAVYERTLKNGLSDSRRLHVAPQATQLYIVVRDATTASWALSSSRSRSTSHHPQSRIIDPA